MKVRIGGTLNARHWSRKPPFPREHTLRIQLKRRHVGMLQHVEEERQENGNIVLMRYVLCDHSLKIFEILQQHL
jgi:hypothetical protein